MKEEKAKIKLRPVIYTTNTFKYGAQNTTQQLFLLKALQVTQDPKKLKQMIGVKTVAEVYRTLDKISMRKEYHEALARQGISFDFIVKGIKNVAEEGFKDGDKLKAYQTLLKSVGLDRYESEGGVGQGSWEEALLKSIDEKKNTPQIEASSEITEYEVVKPETPESVKKMREEEKEMTSSIYENDTRKTDNPAA